MQDDDDDDDDDEEEEEEEEQKFQSYLGLEGKTIQINMATLEK